MLTDKNMPSSSQNHPHFQLSDKDLGDAALGRGELDQAKHFYELALEHQPNSALLKYNLGEVERQRGNIEQTVRYYTDSLALEPFYNSPFVQLLFLETKPEQLEPAASLYRRLAEQQTEPWANVRLGDVLTKQGKIDWAVQNYQRASYKLVKQTYPGYVQQYWDAGEISRPHYIVIGPMKTATSALYEYINQHPKVLPAIKKEVHFFNEAHYSSCGSQWYLSHFPKIPSGSGFITGEASPGYIVNLVQDKIFSLFPDVKLIALTREPIARAYSHHAHNSKHGFEWRSFEEAVNAELDVLEAEDLESAAKLDSMLRRWNWSAYPGYVVLGLYEFYLKQWYSLFSGQLLVIQNQALLNQPEAVMSRVFQFLGIEPFRAATYPKYNAGAYQTQQIKPEIVNRLQRFFAHHNEQLEILLEKHHQHVVT